MALELNATISQKVEVAPGLAILRIIPNDWELPDFKPGQFIAIGLPGSAERYQFAEPDPKPLDPEKMIKRAYSIASSSVEKQYIEFYVRLVTSGELTPRLFNLNIGDKLWMSPKATGMFTLDQIPEDQNIILFATGTGVAPYMSMLRSSAIIQEQRSYAVVHGALNSWDLGYRPELMTIERLCSNFTYIPIISEPSKEPTPWPGKTGFVSKVWDDKDITKEWGFDITPDNTHIFLCGHPLMITGMVELLEKSGFTEHSRKNPGTIHLEKFW